MRIAFTYAALNQVEVNAAYIQIAFLQAPASERHYIICGTEFGLENIGKRALIKGHSMVKNQPDLTSGNIQDHVYSF